LKVVAVMISFKILLKNTFLSIGDKPTKHVTKFTVLHMPLVIQIFWIRPSKNLTVDHSGIFHISPDLLPISII